MWDEGDKGEYNRLLSQKKGQICGDDFSEIIQSVASNPRYCSFLEVGTWNGLGSTKAFANGFAKRSPDSFIFYSLECNVDKSRDAARLYESIPSMHLLNEVLWNEEPDKFFEIFPQCASNPVFKHWHHVDMENMKRCNVFLKRVDLPPIFDVILLDGGEYTTYYDFKIIKDRCSILMLDDTNTDKCKIIVEEIRRTPEVWNIIKESRTRNGFLIAQKIK